jgi:hypothetical protein
MRDWKGIAKASNIDIPDADINRVTDPLNTLEAAFRPLVKDLRFDLEPATVFHSEDGE